MTDGVKTRALLGQLAADGEKEALAVVAHAREEAERILAESAARLKAEIERREAARLEESAVREAAARMEAKGGARRSALGARQLIVDRVIAAAREKLAAATNEEWLRDEVAGVLAYLPEGKARLRCAAKDVASVKELVKSRPDTSVAADSGIIAGVIAETADGTLRVDGTAESRLERMRGAVAIEVVSALERAP